MLLAGNKIRLRPATLDDRRNIFEWLTQSDISSRMIGPPDFDDNPIPDWQEFIADYTPNYFNDLNPDNGKSFIIIRNEDEIGQINYAEIDRTDNTTELDIWLAASLYCNYGYGSDAINTLCHYLAKELNCERCIIAPSLRNQAAVNAYKKCGFVPITQIPLNFIPDYYDTIILEKKLKSERSSGFQV